MSNETGDIGQYTLDKFTPIKCSDTLKWGKWMQSANRTVAKTLLPKHEISTVFLGLDHNFTYPLQQSPPIIFETMVFNRKDAERASGEDIEMDRYATWQEALKGHEEMTYKILSEYYGVKLD